MKDRWFKRLLLKIWRDVPFPGFLRLAFLRTLNPTFMLGALALIQDGEGRVLLLEHTYRLRDPWGLPGGWLKRSETPEGGLVRELEEETGFEVEVQDLAATDLYLGRELVLLYRCRIKSGTFRASEETTRMQWFRRDELPSMPLNQRVILSKVTQ